MTMVDLTESELLLLYRMKNASTTLNTTELSKLMNISIYTLKNYLARLEGKSFVKKEKEAQSIKWSLTQEGNTYINQFITTDVGKAQLILWKSIGLIDQSLKG